VSEFTCRICGAAGNFAAYAAREMMFGSGEAFVYRLCPQCGCLQIEDIPSDMARHYPADYYAQLPRQEPEPAPGIKGAIVRWYCRSAVTKPDSVLGAALRRQLPPPEPMREFGGYLLNSALRDWRERILDVGCGSSPHRLAAFKRAGFDGVEGVDPFLPEDTNYHGVPLRKTTIDRVQGVYGMIMFHHSLEHIADPLGALREAARLLRAGGTCLIRIPVMSTWLWRTFGVDWAELDAPRHLYLMAPRTVDRLADLAGFRVRTTEFDSQGWEIAASRLYQQGMPMFTRGPAGLVSTLDKVDAGEMRDFELKAKNLNDQADAGRACFYLERR
jgi:SAM-dependent methyltransferase